MFAVLLSLVLPAVAQDVPTTEAAAPVEAAVPAPSVADDTATPIGVNVRYRNMFVPRNIIDIWYFDESEPGARSELPRTNIGADVFGLELALEPAPASFLFYAEYWKVRMEGSYWDDREDPPNHNDGDWLTPEKLGIVALGADFGHEMPLSSETKPFWLGLRLGGGLGLAIPTGRIDQWHIGRDFSTESTNACMPQGAAWERKDQCDPDEQLGLPPVAPVLDLDFALRLHLGESGLLRIDTGLHNMVYFGVAGGAVF